MGPVGLFAAGRWAVYVPLENFAGTVGWFLQHRNGMSALVHPNTGCSTADHSAPTWMGAPFPLDIAQFNNPEPTPV